jgi:uncharacterized membrane protein YgcG
VRPSLWPWLVVLAATIGVAQARFEWRDVVQRVDIGADGAVTVVDERTLWTDEDFGDAFVCVQLAGGQRLTLLPETGALSPGPSAVALTQGCDGGTEIVVRQSERVRERRVRFAYRLDGTIAAHTDVVQWYWNVLERDRPPVIGYRLDVRAPGSMRDPYDAFVMRYANPEAPVVVLDEDRQHLSVTFRRVPSGDGVEIRWLMDPRLFTIAAPGRPALQRYLQDQARVSGVQGRERVARTVRAHVGWGLLPAVALAWLGAGTAGAWRRVGREPRTESMRYPFEPPSDLPPAVVPTLLSQHGPQAVRGQAWFATIMDLARRGFLRFEGEGRRFTVHLVAQADATTLEGFEGQVLAYLRQAAASGASGLRDPDSVTIDELRRYGTQHAQRFLLTFGRSIQAWGEGFFGGPYTTAESRATRDRWALRAVAVAVACGFLAWATLDVARGLAIGGAIAAVLVLLVAGIALPAWRPEIAEERAQWLGFRRTLTDYTTMRRAPADFFGLWDRYYVYAAALGVAERYLRTLARAAPAAGMDGAALTHRGAWLGATGANSLTQMSRSISQLSSALASAGASASSGGSSSGGGGGGGGGSSGGR